MSSPTQSVVSSFTETLPNSPTYSPVSPASPFFGFEISHHGLPVVMPEVMVKLEGGSNNDYPAVGKRKRDHSVENERNIKGEVKGYLNTWINLTVFSET
jgi:hypothetical protein